MQAPPRLNLEALGVQVRQDYLSLSEDNNTVSLIWNRIFGGDIGPSIMVQNLQKITFYLQEARKEYVDRCQKTDQMKKTALEKKSESYLKEFYSSKQFNEAFDEELQASFRWADVSQQFCWEFASAGTQEGTLFSLSEDVVKELTELAKSCRGLKLEMIY